MLKFTSSLLAVVFSTLVLMLLASMNGNNQGSSSFMAGVFANVTTNESSTMTSTTETPTTMMTSTTVSSTATATTAPNGMVNISCTPTALFIGQTAICNLVLSRAPSMGNQLNIISFASSLAPAVTLSSHNVSFTTKTQGQVSVTLNSMPNGGADKFIFDWQLTGSASSEFSFAAPSDSYAMFTVKPKMNVTIAPMPSAWYYNGTMTTFNISISGLPPSMGGYISVSPSFGNYGTFTPSSVLFRDAGSASTWSYSVVFKATMPTVNKTAFNMTFAIGGNDYFAYNMVKPFPVAIWPAMTMPPMNTTSANTTAAPITTLVGSSTTATTQQQQMSSTTVTPPPQMTSSTTESQQQQMTTSSTSAPTTTQMNTTTTTVAPAPTRRPRAFLKLRMLIKKILTALQRSNIKSKLAKWLGYPSSLISVGEVDTTTGDLQVSLLAPTTGSVNETLIEEAVEKANDLTATEVGELGAAEVTAEVSAAPGDDDKPDIAVIAGAAAGGLIFLLVILFIMKKNASAGTGVAAEVGTAERPLARMENEMAQQQQQAGNNSNKKTYIDSEL